MFYYTGILFMLSAVIAANLSLLGILPYFEYRVELIIMISLIGILLFSMGMYFEGKSHNNEERHIKLKKAGENIMYLTLVLMCILLGSIFQINIP